MKLFDKRVRLSEKIIKKSKDGDCYGVEKLIHQGADIEIKNKDGRMTPLILASYNGRTDVVRLLLEHGADTDAKDSNGWSALSRARQCNRRGVVSLLVKHNEIRHLCEGNADEKEKALLKASKEGFVEAVKLLLEKGVSVNAKDEHGKTPLMIAILHERTTTIRILKEKGADIITEDNYGNSSISLSKETGTESLLGKEDTDTAHSSDEDNIEISDRLDRVTSHIGITRRVECYEMGLFGEKQDGDLKDRLEALEKKLEIK